MIAASLLGSLFQYTLSFLISLNFRVEPQDFYYPRIGQLVFIVIDALRWDFLTKPENIENVPYITRLLNSGQACLYHAESSPPTVTMPRLKV